MVQGAICFLWGADLTSLTAQHHSGSSPLLIFSHNSSAELVNVQISLSAAFRMAAEYQRSQLVTPPSWWKECSKDIMIISLKRMTKSQSKCLLINYIYVRASWNAVLFMCLSVFCQVCQHHPQPALSYPCQSVLCCLGGSDPASHQLSVQPWNGKC